MFSDTELKDRADLNHRSLLEQLQTDAGGRLTAQYGDCICSSAFQPIVSLTHARVVGHEGLLRAQTADGQAIAPPQLLDMAIAREEILHLDRLCRTLHVANAHAVRDGWLFLNIHPKSFSRTQQANRKAFMADLLAHNGLHPKMVVVEIIEELIEDEDHFRNSVGQLRELGCMLAIDDFGAGHSNFDRIWQVAPEIVKLDRRFAVQCESDPRARRMLPRIVNMLHEAGALVLLEGIETEDQAMIALESDIDFAQGYYFGRPAPEPLPIHQLIPEVTALWSEYDQRYDDYEVEKLDGFGDEAYLITEDTTSGDDTSGSRSATLAVRDGWMTYEMRWSAYGSSYDSVTMPDVDDVVDWLKNDTNATLDNLRESDGI